MSSPASSPSSAESVAERRARGERYWKRNKRYLVVLLALWAAVSFGAGIFWADTLNAIRIPGTGFKLGFWFAQQGAIYVFLVLIAVYVVLMNRLDREMDVDEEFPPRRPGGGRARHGEGRA